MRRVSITVAEETLDDKGRRTRPVSELDRPVHKLVLLLPQDAVTRESPSRSLLQVLNRTLHLAFKFVIIIAVEQFFVLYV